MPTATAAAPKMFTMAQLSDAVPTNMPDRTVVYGPEGVGKTSFAAFASNVAVLHAEKEDGILKLKAEFRVPKTVRVFPAVGDWLTYRGALRMLTAEKTLPFTLLVVDALTALDVMCQEAVCTRDFAGDWSNKGFADYGKGYEQSMREWNDMLDDLDGLVKRHKLSVVLLVHSKLRTFENPEGPNYDRIVPAMHEKTWASTHRWADNIFHLGFSESVRTTDSKRDEGKALRDGGRDRKLFTARTTTYDAKNRAGLPAEIELSQDPSKMWAKYQETLKTARERSAKGEYATESSGGM